MVQMGKSIYFLSRNVQCTPACVFLPGLILAWHYNRKPFLNFCVAFCSALFVASITFIEASGRGKAHRKENYYVGKKTQADIQLYKTKRVMEESLQLYSIVRIENNGLRL